MQRRWPSVFGPGRRVFAVWRARNNERSSRRDSRPPHVAAKCVRVRPCVCVCGRVFLYGFECTRVRVCLCAERRRKYGWYGEWERGWEREKGEKENERLRYRDGNDDDDETHVNTETAPNAHYARFLGRYGMLSDVCSSVVRARSSSPIAAGPTRRHRAPPRTRSSSSFSSFLLSFIIIIIILFLRLPAIRLPVFFPPPLHTNTASHDKRWRHPENIPSRVNHIPLRYRTRSCNN